MEIRPATLNDVIGIVYVQATVWIANYPNETVGISEDDIRLIDWHSKIPAWQHMIKSPQYRVVVAAAGTEVQGFGALQVAPAGPEVYALYVLPEYQRRGLGRQLLKTLLIDNTDGVYLQVAVYNEAAIRFYTSCGFRPSGLLSGYLLPNGKSIPTVGMRRVAAKAAKKLLSRRQLARLSRQPVSTIKWYSELGLLEFEQIAPRQRRYYERASCLRRLGEIGRLQAAGLSIPAIIRRLS